MKMAFGSRFIGCKVDSREQSFGNTFVSSALLTAVIYKYISETTPDEDGEKADFLHTSATFRLMGTFSLIIRRQLTVSLSRPM